jgi:FKBP-type peptidyl-prolyl cis-trans isomerase
VDKQNILMGLRHGIKLMKKSEKVTFLFPSHMAYGYHGDDRRIGTNEPIICTVTLNDIKNENKTTQE